MKKDSLKSHVEKKKRKRKKEWRGGKNHLTPSDRGRKEKVKNLVYLDDGNILNQNGVVFTVAEKKKLESLVNSVNRKRQKQIEQEAQLPRKNGGVDTGDTVASLQQMGKLSDFIIGKRSKSLQRFKSKEDFNEYMDMLKKVNSPDYINDRIRMYKRNHMKALENAFGDDAKDVIMKIRMMKPKDYMELIQSDEELEVSYIYDPSDAKRKLNRIRSILQMKTKD